MPAETSQKPLTFDPLVGAPGHARIECNLSLRLNSNLSQTEHYADEWALKMKLIKNTPSARSKLCDCRVSLLGAGAYPNATEDQLEVATDYMTWLFAFDDICDTVTVNNPQYEAELRIIEDHIIQLAFGVSAEPMDHPLFRSFQDIQTRLSQYGHPSWMDVFALKNKHYMQAVRWERVVRAEGRPPGRSEFDRMRTASGAVEPCLNLFGFFFTNGSSTDLLDCYFIQQLQVFTINIIAHTNDIYSFSKEFQDGTMDNIVMVIKEERDLEWPEAISCAIELVNEDFAAFLDLESKLNNLRGPLDSDTVEYIAGMKAWIISNLDWSAKSGRYGRYNFSWTSSEAKEKEN